MKKRNQAQVLATSTKNMQDWSNYRALRNAVTKKLKTEKKNWQKVKLEQYDNDTGKLWSNVKGLLNWTSVLSPTKLFHEGVIETSPRKLASIMNEFFVNKVITIRQNLPISNKNPLEKLRQLRKKTKDQLSVLKQYIQMLFKQLLVD